MKKLALAFLLCGVSAFATSVTYTTTGVFTSSGTSTSTVPGATIGFTGTTQTVGPLFPTAANFGSFLVTTSGILSTFTDDFTLTIHQMVPAPGGSAVTSTTVSGEVEGSSSQVSLIFIPANVSVAGNPSVAYEFLNGSYGLPANQPTTLQMNVVLTPEPTTLGLLGGSLLTLGYLIRRRTAKK